jgi:hypothetical protein
LAESLAHVALAGATALAWLGAGALVLAPLESSGDPGLDVLNRLGVGAVSFSLLTFAVGWLGLLSAVAYVTVLVLAAAVGVIALARSLRGVQPPRLRAWPRWQLALLGLIAIYVVGDVLVTCAPISSADALFYHATVPELFEREGRIEEVPWMWQSYQPFTVELLVLDGFLLWDSVQGAFAPLLLGLAGGATVFVVARRLAGRGVALLATALFLCQPFALWQLTSTFVEPAAAFTVALAAANLVWYVQGGAGTQALVLAGLFTGATAGMKYFAAGAAAIIALGALVVLWRRLTLRLVVAFAVPALAVALPWYVKNAIVKGDPAYPILFGWDSEEQRVSDWATFNAFGHGHSALDLVLLLPRLLADAEPFNRAEYVTPLLILFAPVALLDPRARRFAGLALACVAAYFLVWFSSVQDARYLLPAMPVLAVLAAVGIVTLARQGRLGRTVAVVGSVSAFAVGSAVSVVYASRFVPYLVGRQSAEAFLRENVSYQESVDWLNANLSPDSRVVVDHVFLLHIEPDALTWTSDALGTTAGPAETRAFVRRYGVTHAIIFKASTNRQRQLAYVGARRIGSVLARPISSRTRHEVGPPQRMDVYEIPRSR